MAHSNIHPKIRRRKVANLAAKSRQSSVSNCTIPKSKYEWNIVPFNTSLDRMPRFGDIKVGGTVYRIDSKGKIIFKNDAYKYEKHPQYKSLHKRIHGQKWIKHKDGIMELKKWNYPSELPNHMDYQKKLWKNLGLAAKMEAYTQYKLKKWEKKHPKPCPTDDLFKDEFIPKWEKERDEALIRIRDFVVSMFDKLPLTGRFKIGDHKFEEEKLTDLKAKNGDGHKVNELKENSKLLKKAQKTVNEVHAKRTNLVAGNLRDHKRQKGRMILPKAA